MPDEPTEERGDALAVQWIPIKLLNPHPENDQLHPDRQIEHLRARYRRLGWYKNVVVTLWDERYTILAGHGMTESASLEGATNAPCHVRTIDPMSDEAIDILSGDNTSDDLAEVQHELRLKHVSRLDEAGRLLGTGVEDDDLAAMRELAQRDEDERPPAVEPVDPETPPLFPVVDPNNMTAEHRCPRCGFEWSESSAPSAESEDSADE